MKNNEVKRYEYLDVAKAIAIIFVYLGHWTTKHIEVFAYSFHLQLFFIIAGLFVISSINKSKSIYDFIKKKFFTIIIPMLLFSWISFIITNLDNSPITKDMFIEVLKKPAIVQPNYWFMPAIFSVSVIYCLLYKFIKKEWIILLIAFLIYIFFNCGIIPKNYDIFFYIDNSKYFEVFNNYFLISAIKDYLLWYSLGACGLNTVKKFVSLKESKNNLYNSIGIILCLVSTALFMYNITNMRYILGIVNSNIYIYCLYKLFATLIISFTVLYLSTYLENNETLKKIGSYTMALMGLEFITHNFIALVILPMLNLGIPNISSSLCVISMTILNVYINMKIIDFFDKSFPIFNGKYSKK